MGKKDKPDTPPPPPPDSSAILSIIEADTSEGSEDYDSKIDSKPKEPKTPSPPPENDAITPVTNENHPENNSTLLKAIRALENDLWTNKSKLREEGTVTLALKYFYRDVYRVPLGV